MSAIFGEILTFGQQNGPDIALRVFGDEHYARYENIDGYSAVYDDQLGVFCYARLSAGSFRSTGTPILARAPPASFVIFRNRRKPSQHAPRLARCAAPR